MSEIVRGTTPTVTYSIPFPVDMLDVGYVTVKQGQNVIIEKELSACHCNGNTVSAKFTQEDTLSLESGCNTKIRLVVKTLGGDRLETKDTTVTVLDTHKDEVF